MINVLNMVFSVVFTTYMKKSHPENVYHYKMSEDDLHFGVNCPANKSDIDKFEEINDNVSVNVFEVDDETGMY